jgi:hypothetical protein
MPKIINYCIICKINKAKTNRYYPCCSENCFELYRNELIEIKCSRWCLENNCQCKVVFIAYRKDADNYEYPCDECHSRFVLQNKCNCCGTLDEPTRRHNGNCHPCSKKSSP